MDIVFHSIEVGYLCTLVIFVPCLLPSFDVFCFIIVAKYLQIFCHLPCCWCKLKGTCCPVHPFWENDAAAVCIGTDERMPAVVTCKLWCPDAVFYARATRFLLSKGDVDKDQSEPAAFTPRNANLILRTSRLKIWTTRDKRLWDTCHEDKKRNENIALDTHTL
jgi:hypothetical protein